MADSTFQRELKHLINRLSKENGSDTPDFILADYLNGCLVNFNMAVQDREEWYGRTKNSIPKKDPPSPPPLASPAPAAALDPEPKTVSEHIEKAAYWRSIDRPDEAIDELIEALKVSEARTRALGFEMSDAISAMRRL